MGCMLWIGGISVVIVGMIFLIAPLVFGSRKNPDLVKAINNARQIGIALFDFESKYGKFPDSSTVPAVQRDTGSTLTLPDRTSNDLFAQLIASGIAPGEHMFYAKAEFMRRPDDIFHSDSTILEHGECAFAYISGLSYTGDPSRPIAFGPVIPGTATLDRKSCDGYAVVLRLDGSVSRYQINSSGKIISNGFDLFDPRQPFWHGKAPDVKWPK